MQLDKAGAVIQLKTRRMHDSSANYLDLKLKPVLNILSLLIHRPALIVFFFFFYKLIVRGRSSLDLPFGNLRSRIWLPVVKRAVKAQSFFFVVASATSSADSTITAA